jgi:hypothetical protein
MTANRPLHLSAIPLRKLRFRFGGFSSIGFISQDTPVWRRGVFAC